MPKGTTIGKFLEAVRNDLVKDFVELKSVAADALMYIKEDLIIPQARVCLLCCVCVYMCVRVPAFVCMRVLFCTTHLAVCRSTSPSMR